LLGDSRTGDPLSETDAEAAHLWPILAVDEFHAERVAAELPDNHVIARHQGPKVGCDAGQDRVDGLLADERM